MSMTQHDIPLLIVERESDSSPALSKAFEDYRDCLDYAQYLDDIVDMDEYSFTVLNCEP